MEIQYHGANCISISFRKNRVVIDDNLADLGLKTITTSEDILISTGISDTNKIKSYFTISQPGEYEISNISVNGISARSHTDEEGDRSAVIYKLVLDDVRIAVTGHIYPDLSEDQLEAIGTVDILVIPVGDNGYTMDGVGALKIIKEISPKIVIPTHFSDPKIKYPVEQKSLQEALKELAMEPKETIDTLKIKGLEFSDTTQLIVLERQ